MTKRVPSILYLCLLFSLVLWQLGYPFLGEHFQLRSEMLLHSYVMGSSAPSTMHRTRYLALSSEQRSRLEQRLKELTTYATRSAFKKLADGINLFFSSTPLWELIWIPLAVVVCVRILKERPTSTKMMFFSLVLLPFCGWITVPHPPMPPDQALYPTESFLIERYSPPTQIDTFERLSFCWNCYLREFWGKDHSSNEDGAFRFHLARLEARANIPWQGSLLAPPHPAPSVFTLFFILGTAISWRRIFA